jgi:hypothetical protein
MDEAPFLEIDEMGFGVDKKRMYWELEHPNRQLFFDNARNKVGCSQIGIWIEDLDKLLKNLKKDLKLSDKIVKAIKNEEVELYLETSLFGGGSGKTYFQYEDRTEKGIESKTFNKSSLQKWFDENVVNMLLDSFQKEYDYLTSEKSIIETLDVNEMLFNVKGEKI